MTLLGPLGALALAQLVGALLRALPSLARGTAPAVALRAPLTSPASVFVALAVLYAASLGVAGSGILVALVAAALWPLRTEETERAPGFSRAVLALLTFALVAILARPLVPTCWDEFVWLGKARFESEGFGGGVRMALDPGAHLMPPGYPTLWPAAAGWLALGADDLGALTAAASLLVWVALAAFVERLDRIREDLTPAARAADVFLASALCVAAPLVLVHARTTYVDLPLGLLGTALLLELAGAGPSPVVATSLAVVLVGIKDEGAAHLLAAVLGAAFVARARGASMPRALAFAFAGGVVALSTWQTLVSLHGIGRDHGGLAPAFSWAARLPLLLAAHATELTSWGFFWPAVVVAGVHGRSRPAVRTLALALAVNLACVAAMLVLGPPRVRAFADNGTLVNRVLVQLWPLGVAVLASLPRGASR